MKDDILNDINFDDRINLDDDLLEFQKSENNKDKEKEKDKEKKLNSNEDLD